MRVILYERQDCGLCAEAYAALRRLRVDVERVDIDAGEVDRDRYTLRVPVVRQGEHELDAAGLEDAAIARWLAAP